MRAVKFLISLLFIHVAAAWSDRSVSSVTEYVQKTIVAHPIDSPVKLDGVLNEASWNTIKPAAEFVQTEPVEGGVPSVTTEVRILYDENNLYIGVICNDKEPDKITHKELMRDGSVLLDDYFVVGLDTYNGKRMGYYFGINPNGAMIDGLINGYNSLNNDWDGVWDCSARITELGWSAEILIPFKTLRFYNSEIQVWGVNFERVIQRYNEQIFWTGWKRNDKISQVSRFGALTGIKNIRRSKHVEVKPYVLAGREDSENNKENTLKYGIDIMYGIKSNLTLDLTTHTDFAQIEVDEEIINIDRFDVFRPEKRDFFLEGGEVFNFGSGESYAQMFYTRRIGLTPDRKTVPILAGGKLTGKIGDYEVGILNMQTKEQGDFASTNYGVIRVKKDILGNSFIGCMAANLYDTNHHGNQAYGVDFAYKTDSFLRGQNLEINGFVSGTETPGLKDNNFAGRLLVNLPNDLFSNIMFFRVVGDNFNPEMGFIRRNGIRKYQQLCSITPRVSIPHIKKLIFEPINIQYVTDSNDILSERTNQFTLFGIETKGNDTIKLKLYDTYQYLEEDFNIFSDTMIPRETYQWWNQGVTISTYQGRSVSFTMDTQWGDFYNGKRKYLNTELLFKINKNLAVSTDTAYNNITVAEGNFRTREYGSKIFLNLNTRLSSSAYIQYNNELNEVLLNLRLHYIPKIGSDLYFVYNPIWDETRNYTTIQNTAVFKIDYLFRF